MRALVMSAISLARTVASRRVGLVRAHFGSILSRVRAAVSRGGPARTTAASIVTHGRDATARARRWAQHGRATIVGVGRAVAARAEGPTRAGALLVARLARGMAAHTQGVGRQVYLAFTLSFVLAMIVGTMLLSVQPRAYRTAAPLAPDPRIGAGAVTPTVDPLPEVPSVTLPRLVDPSKRADEAARLLGAAPAGRTPAATVAVRSTGSVRGEIAKVREIALWGNPSKPWVSITATAPVRYQLRKVEPDWVVIDVTRAELALSSGKPPAGRGLVRLIRVGQFTPDTVRVVLELTEAVPIHVATSPGKNAIVVSLAVDAKGNSHTDPAPGQRPGAAKPVPMARAGDPVAGQ